jgi:hypothetical protein
MTSAAKANALDRRIRVSPAARVTTLVTSIGTIMGPVAALVSQAGRAPLSVTLAPDGVGHYGRDVQATVTMLDLRVVDDGAGSDPAAISYGTGLQEVADRLDAVCGSLTVTSGPVTGTTVAGRVPLPQRGTT